MRAGQRLVFGLAAAAGLLATAACIFVLDEGLAGGTAATSDLHKILAFPPGGTLSLRNLDGDIEIRGWDREEIELRAESGAGYERWGYAGGRPRFDIEEAPGRLALRTRWEGDAGRTRPVRLTLSVPRSLIIEEASTQIGSVRIFDLYGRAAVSILEGDLDVANFSGGLTASIGRGRARAELLDLRPGDEVRLTVREGDIRLDLEPGVSASLEAEATAGIDSDWEGAAAKAGRVQTKLGAGEASIVARTGKGAIEIRRTPERP
jgi:hypothetical protein